MWDDFGGMAYRGEICTRRSLGVDAVSQELFRNFLNLCEVYNTGFLLGLRKYCTHILYLHNSVSLSKSF